MFETIKNYFARWFSRTPREASQPYFPKPPSPQEQPLQDPQAQDTTNSNMAAYCENVTHEHNILGTPLTFGERITLMVDQNQNATEYHGKISYILGSGLVVSQLESKIIDGKTMPGVGGRCWFCHQEAVSAFQAGHISLQDAQLMALFDTESAGHCDKCGRQDVCSRHSRPFPGPNGQPFNLCAACSASILHEQENQRFMDILLFPLMEEDPPSSKE